MSPNSRVVGGGRPHRISARLWDTVCLHFTLCLSCLKLFAYIPLPFLTGTCTALVGNPQGSCNCCHPVDLGALPGSANWRKTGMLTDQVLALQVTARYCNFFGVVDEYSISVLDDAGDEFPVEDVPPGQIYMHFPPGSRVNVRWKRPVQVSTATCPLASASSPCYAAACLPG